MNAIITMLLETFSGILPYLYRKKDRVNTENDNKCVRLDNVLRLDTATRKMRKAHIDYSINHEQKTLEIPMRSLYTGIATLTIYRIVPNDGRQPYWAISKDGFELIFRKAQND